MANNNQRRIIGYDPQTGQPIFADPSGSGKKVIKGILIAVIVAVLGVGGWFIYDNFFNLIPVDLFAYMDELPVYGFSGDGYIDYDSDFLYYQGDWAGDPLYTESFYSGITYTVDKDTGLSNGDTVTVKANYDKSLARKCKVKVKEDKKTFEVTGLRERYKQDLSDMSAEDFASVKSYMNDYMAREANNNEWTVGGMVKLMFIYRNLSNDDEEDYDDTLVAIYKITYQDWWDDKAVTAYVPVFMDPIAKQYDYANEIDQLVANGDIGIYDDGRYDSLEELVNDIKTNNNRETVTDLAV